MNKGKNLKIILGMSLIVLAIVYLIFSSMQTATAAYYMTVEEALNGNIEPDKYYRVEGKINLDEVNYDTTKTPVELKFQIYEEKDPSKKITVIYNDIKPDNFEEAISAVVQGKFDSKGILRADSLNLKCPSKYEQKNSTQDEGVVTKFLRSLGLKR
ncbi:cytochrome c maturation protein CcmE [Desulfitobacterium sp.]|uniref:cytochrome c maturation protein CcmE n=1 Tax=Desulfitobacterium sp. TaxID=49981 RepID=UPI002B86AD8A|nr:cytochrome c maturation protein CcmE [Desulfitobacterium sp.]HVJ47691.1 cytochrome c maturation protein CcmE [Desulfitobacterium sp.]